MMDAVLIRILKARKQLKLKEIFEDVLKITSSYIPTPKLIKSRLESLIGREYVKRDEKDS